MFGNFYEYARKPINAMSVCSRGWIQGKAIVAILGALMAMAAISVCKSAVIAHSVLDTLFRPQIMNQRQMILLPHPRNSSRTKSWSIANWCTQLESCEVFRLGARN